LRKLGHSDITASAIALGTWAMGGWMWGGHDDEASIAAIRASIDKGVTLIDTAPAYGLGRAEALVGQAVKGRRHEVVIATKCGLNWHHGKGNHFFDEMGHKVHRYLGHDGILHEIEQSLARLQTDYIDLYITHWQDATTPIEETVRALEELKAAGKIRAIGASNVDRSELRQYIQTGSLDAIQERFSMIDRGIEADLLPLTVQNGVSTLSYSSLALGLLSGTIGPDRIFSGDDQRKDNPRFSVANRQKAKDFSKAIRPVAELHGASVAQVVIAWTLAQPGVTFALCGARNPAQAFDNARAGTLRLSADDLKAIDAALVAKLAHMDG
jgi:aryl-alcohol dehydrogenase-like predicted oxidoreductase